MVSYDRVSEHPLRWALVTGSLIFAWVLFLSGSLIIAVGTGIGMLLLSWSLWRPGGPGHRFRKWVVRRFPERE